MIVIRILISILLFIASIAIFTLFERNYLACIQSRVGPNKVGPWGLFQPLADAVKLLSKSFYSPIKANIIGLLAGPLLAFIIPLIGWSVIPTYSSIINCLYGIFFLYCLSTLLVYSLLLRGWSSNSKYRMVGAIRGVAQSISYEVSIAFSIISMVLIGSSLDITSLYFTSTTPGLCLGVNACLWLVIILAERNRTPFDLPEGERELVSGFNTEYSGIGFTLLFISEYLGIILLSGLTSLLFLTNWLLFPFILYFFVVSRAILPRIRRDILIYLTWVSLLPMVIRLVLLAAFIQ